MLRAASSWDLGRFCRKAGWLVDLLTYGIVVQSKYVVVRGQLPCRELLPDLLQGHSPTMNTPRAQARSAAPVPTGLRIFGGGKEIAGGFNLPRAEGDAGGSTNALARARSCNDSMHVGPPVVIGASILERVFLVQDSVTVLGSSI